jgi:hypothetical protein
LPGADERTLGEILGIVRELSSGHPVVEKVDGYTDAQFGAASIPELLGEKYDEFYYAHDSTGTVCRRLAAAYPEARTVCIGDAFGMVYPANFVASYQSRTASNVAKEWIKALAAALRLRAPGIAPVIPQVAALVLPVDTSGHGLRGLGLVCCRKQDFLDAIHGCHANAAGLRSHMQDLLDRGRGRKRYLLLTETYAEAGHVQPLREISMYCEFIRTHCEPGSMVFIKPHPLESPGKGDRIRNEIGPGHEIVDVDPRFARYPIEIWEDLVRGCTVICSAYPVLSLKYAYGIDVVQPMDDAMIERWIEPAHRGWSRDSLRLYMEPLARLGSWDGRSVLWSPERG